MQRQDITEQRDQGPRFLRVPAPESAPGIIRPHATKNRARRQQQHAELKDAIKPEMHRRVRTCRCRVACVPPEQNVPEAHGQCERRVAQRDREHVDRKPEIIAQYRYQRIDA